MNPPPLIGQRQIHWTSIGFGIPVEAGAVEVDWAIRLVPGLVGLFRAI